MSAHLRLVSRNEEPVYSIHRNQFHSRQSSLPIGYFEQPWFTKRVWRWTAIGLLIVAIVGLALTGSDVPHY